MQPDKKSVLFAGGKLISIESSDLGNDKQGFMLTKNADKTWIIQVNAIISEAEATNAIFLFSDLKTEAGKTPEEANPNMPYIEALDDTGKAVFVKLEPNSTITPSYYRDILGSITLKLNMAVSKTQNAKTQNA